MDREGRRCACSAQIKHHLLLRNYNVIKVHNPGKAERKSKIEDGGQQKDCKIERLNSKLQLESDDKWTNGAVQGTGNYTCFRVIGIVIKKIIIKKGALLDARTITTVSCGNATIVRLSEWPG